MQAKHAYLFGPEHYGHDDDDTCVDVSAPDPPIGSHRWHWENFALMEQYGQRTDDYHEMESVELSIPIQLKTLPASNSIKTDEEGSGIRSLDLETSSNIINWELMNKQFEVMYGASFDTDGDNRAIISASGANYLLRRLHVPKSQAW